MHHKTIGGKKKKKMKEGKEPDMVAHIYHPSILETKEREL